MSFSVSKWQPLILPPKGRPWLVLMFIHMGVTALIGGLLPTVTQHFYQDFTKGSLLPFVQLGGLFLLEYINRLGYQISTYRYVVHLLREARSKTYELWLRASLKHRCRHKSDEDFPMGEVLARVMSDTDAVKELVTSGAFGIVIDLVFIVASLVGFLRIESQVGMGLFAIEILACTLLIWGSRKMVDIFASVRQITGLVSRVVSDVTHGLRELAFLPHAHYASRRGDKVFDDFLKQQLKANIWDAGYYSTAESLYPIMLSLVLIFFPSGETARLALLAVLIDLIQKSITPIKEVAGKISSIQRARTGLERIMEFQEHFTDDRLTFYSTLEPLQGLEINLRHYAYTSKQDETVFKLEEIKLRGRPGELIGIVGESGCGKSTFLKLLTGQHGSFAADIELNQHRLNGEKAEDLRLLSQYVSLVSQDSHVFTDTLAFNISLEGEIKELPHFWDRAQAALPYLRKWGVGLDDAIDPKQLSVGQKQLICGLRACYLHKPIVLFDEVSTGLDPDLEKALRDLILFVQRQSLTIIVTHRLETILSANQLLLLANGRLLDQGSASQLRERSQVFRDFLSSVQDS